MFIWTVLEHLNWVGIDLPMNQHRKDGLSLPEWDTSLYNSVTGGYTDTIFGNFRHNFTLAERVDSVQIYGDIFQLAYSPSESATSSKKKFGNLLYEFMVSGSDNRYTFGKRKDFNFHFTPGFTVDRMNTGSARFSPKLTEEQKKSLRYIVDEWKPDDTVGNMKMILPCFFCASLVALKLLIDYEFNWAPKVDFGEDGAAKASGESNVLKLPWFKLTAQNLLTGLGIMNSLFMVLLEQLEKAFCAEDLLLKKMFPQIKMEINLIYLLSINSKVLTYNLTKSNLVRGFGNLLEDLDYAFSDAEYAKNNEDEMLSLLASEKKKIEGFTWWFREKIARVDNKSILSFGN